MTGGDAASAQLKRLIHLLDEERAVLLSGDFSRLEEVAAMLGQELDRLEKLSLEPSKAHEHLLSKMAKMAERNLALAEGSRRGVRVAARRIAEASGGAAKLTTYSKDGETTTLSNQRHQRDHRT